jgi:nitrate reductase NapAB chaperone NapD
MRLLIKTGADVNSMNEWKYSSLLVSMLKNHKLLTRELLELKEVDVNGTDETGRTLLSYAV